MLLLLFLFCLGEAAYGEETNQMGLLDLCCVQGEEVKSILGAVKLQDPKTGAEYLVSSGIVGELQDEYEFILLEGDDPVYATVLGSQSGLSFLRADGMENYTSFRAETQAAPDMDTAQILVYYEGEFMIYRDGLSGWEKTETGWYDSGEEPEQIWLLGCPVINPDTSGLIGILSLNPERGSSLAMVDLSEIRLPEEWAITGGAQSAEDPESEGTGDSGDKEGSEDPGSEGAGTSGNGGADDGIPSWVLVAVIVACAAVILNRSKKQKEKPEPHKEEKDVPPAVVISPVSPVEENVPAVEVDRTQDRTQDRTYRLVGTAGDLKGRIYEIRGIYWIGRTEDCQIRYPQDTGGISRHHCEVMTKDGKLFLMDVGSAYGTYLSDGTKLEKNVIRELKVGDAFYLADPNQMFRVE